MNLRILALNIMTGITLQANADLPLPADHMDKIGGAFIMLLGSQYMIHQDETAETIAIRARAGAPLDGYQMEILSEAQHSYPEMIDGQERTVHTRLTSQEQAQATISRFTESQRRAYRMDSRMLQTRRLGGAAVMTIGGALLTGGILQDMAAGPTVPSVSTLPDGYREIEVSGTTQ